MPRTRRACDVLRALEAASPGVAARAARAAAAASAAPHGGAAREPMLRVLAGGVCREGGGVGGTHRGDELAASAGLPPGGVSELLTQLDLLSSAGDHIVAESGGGNSARASPDCDSGASPSGAGSTATSPSQSPSPSSAAAARTKLPLSPVVPLPPPPRPSAEDAAALLAELGALQRRGGALAGGA